MATLPSAAAWQEQEKQEQEHGEQEQQMIATQGAARIDGKPRSALASPSLGGVSKAVSIAEPESSSPNLSSRLKDHESDAHAPLSLGPHASRTTRSKKHKVQLGRSSASLHRARTPADLLHLPSSHADNHSAHAIHGSSQPSGPALGTTAIQSAEQSDVPSSNADAESVKSKKSRRAIPRGHLTYHDLVNWVQKEKYRRAASKAKRKDRKQQAAASETSVDQAISEKLAATALLDVDATNAHQRRGSETSQASSEGSAALEMLQDILERNASVFAHSHANRSSHSLRAPGSIRKLRRGSTAGSSDNEMHEADVSVPSCDVFLDNSRALSSANDVPSPGGSRPHLPRSLSNKEKDSWRQFKYEIVRLTHTLKLKGWRAVPMEKSNGITVERLSGALTNSVYVVTPPSEHLDDSQSESDVAKAPRRAKPRKLLLRIYGSQVEHLIDREAELAILRRLARKRIGPRMLGTFQNGRFEEHFDARPLTAKDLRQADCSRQIAKRFRELHDGIELLSEEVAAGPFVWQNIDKWMRRCERIVGWIEENRAGDLHSLAKGHVIGSDFGLFKDVLQRYRSWLEESYNGWEAVHERLVFAHNDAQYGNILRLQNHNKGKITPENEHKQLIVIDFEYANANVPGLEFANHFTEWCYNYHDPEASYLCKVQSYPGPAEQTNFFASYVSHRPSFPPARGTLSHRASTTSLQSLPTSLPPTPTTMHPAAPAVGMVSSFMLEARSQPGPASTSITANTTNSAASSETLRDPLADADPHADAQKREIERLRWETRAWRGVNSAQWAMWGIVQATIPGMPAFSDIASPYLAAKDEAAQMDPDATPKLQQSETVFGQSPEIQAVDEDDDEEGFDYLKYAFERARFFWGDVIALNILKPDEVSDDIRVLARVLEY